MKKIFFSNLILFFLFLLPAQSDSEFELGKSIFLGKGNCATCHTLADAKSNGQIGPNLNEIKPDIARVLSAVINGIGVMPAYQGTLSKDEIKAVAHYVSFSVNE